MLLLGCSGNADKVVSVEGTITIDGKPLPADAIGSITFQTTRGGQGKTASAEIKDGAYRCSEVPLGKVRVFITVQQPTGRMIDNGRGTPAAEFRSIFSPKFSSGVDLQVEGDLPDQNFDLGTT